VADPDESVWTSVQDRMELRWRCRLSRKGPQGVLAITRDRVLFGVPRGRIGTLVFGSAYDLRLSRPRAELIDIAMPREDVVELAFAPGAPDAAARVELYGHVSVHDATTMLRLFDLGLDEAQPGKRVLGEVVDRVCSNCSHTCICPVPRLVPVGLAGWGDVFSTTPASYRRHDRFVVVDDASTRPVRRRDVVDIAFRAVIDGRDVERWLAIVQLGDGRWVLVDHQDELLGMKSRELVVAATLEELWRDGLTDEIRDHLAPQLSRDELADELVRLDRMLESADDEQRRYAAARMRQLHVTGLLAAHPRV
jgi:hypothetical protein